PPYGPRTNDLNTPIPLSKPPKPQNIKLLLHFHYTHFSTHPPKHFKPKPSTNLSQTHLQEPLPTYTTHLLKPIKA
ncbi:glycosyl hydrolase 53 family protein, partial [Bacillus altitudinis]|uniref:glycosyl hydrolase 53 family protein n=1 Tax=Bacillus altitudinis TaxID=293387 RepID=UPI001643AB78